MTNEEGQAAVARFNQEGAEQVREQGETIRADVIERAYNAVSIFLAKDKARYEQLEEQGFPENARDERFVIEDIHQAPSRDDELPQTTISLLLAPREITNKPELLRIHVPVQGLEELRDYEMPPIEDVKCIFLEYIRPGVESRRYVLTKDYMYEYKTAADTGEENLLGSSERIIFNAIHKIRTDSTVHLALKAQTDLIEMEATVQWVDGDKLVDNFKKTDAS